MQPSFFLSLFFFVAVLVYFPQSIRCMGMGPPSPTPGPVLNPNPVGLCADCGIQNLTSIPCETCDCGTKCTKNGDCCCDYSAIVANNSLGCDLTCFSSCTTYVDQSTDQFTCYATLSIIPPHAFGFCAPMTQKLTTTFDPTKSSNGILYEGLNTVSYFYNGSFLCNTTIDVVDRTPPLLTCSTNVQIPVQATLGGGCDGIVNYTTPTAYDNCDGVTTVNASKKNVANYSPQLAGIYNLTFYSTDSAGNKGSCSFLVTVEDYSPPVITSCQANIVTNTTFNKCTFRVNYTVNATSNCGSATLNVLQGFPSGYNVPYGNYTYIIGAQNPSGVDSSSTCSFSVEVDDKQVPIISCPSNYTVPTDLGKCYATLNYTYPTAVDNCAVNVSSPTPNLPQGSQFPLGITNLTFTATDIAGNTANCTFSVTVFDNQKPNISCSLYTAYATGQSCSAPVSFSFVSVVDNCAVTNISQTYGIPNGTLFPVGNSFVELQAADEQNNSVSCVLQIQVIPDAGPTISCPPSITAYTLAYTCKAAVQFTTPVGTYPCLNVTTVRTAGIGPDQYFPLGVTTDVYTVYDNFNSSSCNFTVTVIDNVPPVPQCPSGITVQTTSCSTPVLINLNAFDNCGNYTYSVTSGIPLSSNFPLGNTTEVVEFKDSAGNIASCSFWVYVSGTGIPSITCPSSIVTQNAPGFCYQTVTYASPVSSADCQVPTLTLVSGLSSGSNFPVGVTNVTYEASTVAGSAFCSFFVTVNNTQLPTITCPPSQTLNTTTLSCSASTLVATPVSSSNCPLNISILAGASPSGSFSLGTTTLVWEATDPSGLTATCQSQVTVVDTVPPQISCELDRVSIGNMNEWKAFLTTIDLFSKVVDNCGFIEKVTASKLVFNYLDSFNSPVTVLIQAYDYSGNIGSCNSSVYVQRSSSLLYSPSTQEQMIINSPFTLSWFDAKVFSQSDTIHIWMTNPGTNTIVHDFGMFPYFEFSVRIVVPNLPLGRYDFHSDVSNTGDSGRVPVVLNKVV